MRTKMMVKEWLLDKTQNTATRYNCFIDFERDEKGNGLVVDGFLTVTAEVLEESEKAYKVKLETGSVLGSHKGWTTWLPKSNVKIIEK